jgi:hypothetical protein
MSYLSMLTDAVAASQRDALRVGVQTVAASALTFLLMSWFSLPHMSWAVISALFTIQLSADSAMQAALGRLAGSLIGVALGLAAVSLIGGQGAMLIRLVMAAALANAVATVWPSLRYAAVTAAIVTLNHDPKLGGALEIAFAILIGSAIGTAAAFLAWPDFGRRRTARALRKALNDCRDLLELTVKDIGGSGERAQDAVHARFLSDLESARARASATWFRPRLPSGVGLQDALIACESLWHGLVILDRALGDERENIGARTLGLLKAPIRKVQLAACQFLDDATDSLGSSEGQAPDAARLRDVVGRARSEAFRLGSEGGLSHAGKERSKGLHALVFALDEVERRLVEIAALTGKVQSGREGCSA